MLITFTNHVPTSLVNPRRNKTLNGNRGAHVHVQGLVTGLDEVTAYDDIDFLDVGTVEEWGGLVEGKGVGLCVGGVR